MTLFNCFGCCTLLLGLHICFRNTRQKYKAENFTHRYSPHRMAVSRRCPKQSESGMSEGNRVKQSHVHESTFKKAGKKPSYLVFELVSCEPDNRKFPQKVDKTGFFLTDKPAVYTIRGLGRGLQWPTSAYSSAVLVLEFWTDD